VADKLTSLTRLQLTDVLRGYEVPKTTPPPRGGWVRAIREALGMTQSQLGTRAGISRQSVQDMEQAEAERRITLESLDRLARAMGCRVVLSVVPEQGSLDDLRRQRAEAMADTLLKSTDHSMKLEAQGVTVPERERQRKLLVESLLSGSARKLWQ
jgi:predicted DNA-binding mobile mystery protein A